MEPQTWQIVWQNSVPWVTCICGRNWQGYQRTPVMAINHYFKWAGQERATEGRAWWRCGQNGQATSLGSQVDSGIAKILSSTAIAAVTNSIDRCNSKEQILRRDSDILLFCPSKKHCNRISAGKVFLWLASRPASHKSPHWQVLSFDRKTQDQVVLKLCSPWTTLFWFTLDHFGQEPVYFGSDPNTTKSVCSSLLFRLHPQHIHTLNV